MLGGLLVISGYATLMSPNEDETAVCGSHCLDCWPDEVYHISNRYTSFYAI